MKKIIFAIIIFTSIIFAQDSTFTAKVDSVYLAEIQKDFQTILKQYQQTDSLQIKRLGVMEYLQLKYQEKRKAKKK